MTNQKEDMIQYWNFNAGSVWNANLFMFCQNKQDIRPVQQNDDDQLIDLIIYYGTKEGEIRSTTIVELKGSDLHSSLFPRKNKQGYGTSLIKELNEHYVPFSADQKMIVCCNGKGMFSGKTLPKGLTFSDRLAFKEKYRLWRYNEVDYFRLINMMNNYPDFHLYIYETMQAAIFSIYEKVKSGIKEVNLSKPVYIKAGDWTLAHSLYSGLENFSLEFAQFLVEELHLKTWYDCVEELTEYRLSVMAQKYYGQEKIKLPREIRKMLAGEE